MSSSFEVNIANNKQWNCCVCKSTVNSTFAAFKAVNFHCDNCRCNKEEFAKQQHETKDSKANMKRVSNKDLYKDCTVKLRKLNMPTDKKLKVTSMTNGGDVLERKIKVSTKRKQKVSPPETMSEWMMEFMRQNPNNYLDNHNSLDRDTDPLSLGPETLTIEESYSLKQLNLENQPTKPGESNVCVDIADEAKIRVPKEWFNKLRNLAENLSSMSREIIHMIDSNEQKVEIEGITDVRMQ